MLTDDWDYVQNAVSGFGALPKAIQSYIEIRVNTKYIHVVFRLFMSQKTFCTVSLDMIFLGTMCYACFFLLWSLKQLFLLE